MHAPRTAHPPTHSCLAPPFHHLLEYLSLEVQDVSERIPPVDVRHTKPQTLLLEAG